MMALSLAGTMAKHRPIKILAHLAVLQMITLTDEAGNMFSPVAKAQRL